MSWVLFLLCFLILRSEELIKLPRLSLNWLSFQEWLWLYYSLASRVIRISILHHLATFFPYISIYVLYMYIYVYIWRVLILLSSIYWPPSTNNRSYVEYHKYPAIGKHKQETSSWKVWTLKSWKYQWIIWTRWDLQHFKTIPAFPPKSECQPTHPNLYRYTIWNTMKMLICKVLICEFIPGAQLNGLTDYCWKEK